MKALESHGMTYSMHTSPSQRTTRITTWLGTLALLLLSPLAAIAGNTLQDISFAALPGDRVHVTLTMSQGAELPASFTMDNPARISLDFADTTSTVSKRSQSAGIGNLSSITAVEAGGRTRVVLNLVESVPYETRVEGNEVHIFIDGASSNVDSAGASVAMADSPGSTVITADTGSISDIDFRRGQAGEGRIMITLDDPGTIVDMREEGGKVVLYFLNSKLPERLSRRLDVTDFATPVATIDTYERGNDIRMVVDATGEYDYLSYQADELFTVEFKPLTKAEKEKLKKDRMQYTGERLSLNFQTIEVRAVLQLLADFTGLNMVTSDSVSGSLTLRLKNVPWDQALDIILKTKGLSKRQTGNVMLVAPTEEIAAREKLELESQKQIEELAPLRSEYIQINYAKAADLAALLKAKENQLMSERGNVTVDQRTNTLLVQDTRDNLQRISQMIARLDIPVRQVLIEARIVIANNDFAKDLGVKIGVSGKDSSIFKDRTLVYGGGIDGDQNNSAISGGPFIEKPAGSGNEALLADLGAANATSAIDFILGKFGSNVLRLELSAMQQEGRGEVISSPRVITANQHEAIIKQGVEIPYQEATSSGATSTSFKDAVLSLRVTPQITPDDRIIMDLQINKDRPDFSNITGGVPPINTQEVQTQVLVDNGETVVLGGIYEQEKTYSSERTPFFGDLPYLGRLFRQELNVDDQRELLIFVTPKILKEQLSVR